MSFNYSDPLGARRTPATETEPGDLIRIQPAAAPAPGLTVMKIALAVFLGNLFTAILGAVVYFLVTAK